MKSGVYFVEKQYIETFLRQCEVSGYYLASGESWNEELNRAKRRLRNGGYLSYSIATYGRIGCWGFFKDDVLFKGIYETWDLWDFSEAYKEIYKLNKRKITI